jgi:hypothetical protein
MGRINLAGFQAEIDLKGIGLWIANVLIIKSIKHTNVSVTCGY